MLITTYTTAIEKLFRICGCWWTSFDFKTTIWVSIITKICAFETPFKYKAELLTAASIDRTHLNWAQLNLNCRNSNKVMRSIWYQLLLSLLFCVCILCLGMCLISRALYLCVCACVWYMSLLLFTLLSDLIEFV